MLVILWITGGLVAVVALAMLLLPMFVDEQALLDMAQAQVKNQTGGELVVEGETELSFFPRFGLRIESTSLDLPIQASALLSTNSMSGCHCCLYSAAISTLAPL